MPEQSQSLIEEAFQETGTQLDRIIAALNRIPQIDKSITYAKYCNFENNNLCTTVEYSIVGKMKHGDVPLTSSQYGDLIELSIGNAVTELEYDGNQGFAGLGALQYDIDAGEGRYYTLTSIVFPSSPIVIGDSAFANNGTIDSIDIPDNVVSIGDSIFYHCDALANVTLPSNLTTLPLGTFDCCYSLTGVVLPESLETIGSIVFSNCPSLGSVTIPASVQNIAQDAFTGSSLTAVFFNGKTLSEIEDEGFLCTGLNNGCVVIDKNGNALTVDNSL